MRRTRKDAPMAGGVSRFSGGYHAWVRKRYAPIFPGIFRTTKKTQVFASYMLIAKTYTSTPREPNTWGDVL